MPLRSRFATRAFAVGAAGLCGLLLAVALLSRQSCNTRNHLTPLLLDMGVSLDRHGVTWALEGGTLLGAMREGNLLAHEFDNDITVPYSPTLAAQMELVRADMAQLGYHLLSRGTHSYAKGLVNLYTGRYNPYIEVVDYRLYDTHMWYYTDLYMDNVVPAAQLDRVRAARQIPAVPLAPCASYHCNHEPTVGGCRATSYMIPWRTMSFLGRTVLVPRNAEAVLHQVVNNKT